MFRVCVFVCLSTLVSSQQQGETSPLTGADTSVKSFDDLSGYFFNAMIIISSLLLVSNLMGITLFPNITQVLKNVGDLIQDQLNILKGKSGRSLDIERLNHMSVMVEQAIHAFDKMN